VLRRGRASDFFRDWEKIANDAVAILRAEAGRDPYDKLLSHLIGELSTRSDEFRVRWAAHNVKFHRTGAKTLHHPVVGDLTLDYEALDLPGDTGQRILVYSAEPGSASQQALGVVIATPTPAHAAVCGEMAAAFPAARILVEKPAADTSPARGWHVTPDRLRSVTVTKEGRKLACLWSALDLGWRWAFGDVSAKGHGAKVSRSIASFCSSVTTTLCSIPARPTLIIMSTDLRAMAPTTSPPRTNTDRSPNSPVSGSSLR
jgi:hypothetical protein